MPYSNFTSIGKVKQAFSLTTQEGIRFLPEINFNAIAISASTTVGLSRRNSESDYNSQCMALTYQ
jgi:hypothetical protein